MNTVEDLKKPFSYHYEVEQAISKYFGGVKTILYDQKMSYSSGNNQTWYKYWTSNDGSKYKSLKSTIAEGDVLVEWNSNEQKHRVVKLIRFKEDDNWNFHRLIILDESNK